MQCGGDKTWVLFYKVGPSAMRMYNLMIVTDFLRGENPQYRWGSPSAKDLEIVTTSQFNLNKVDDKIEDYNAAIEYEEDYAEEDHVARETHTIIKK